MKSACDRANTYLGRSITKKVGRSKMPRARWGAGWKPLAIWGLVLPIVLSSCSNPYGLTIHQINYAAEQKQGLIQFTDPKLYKREALINERRDELNYLETLLAQSRTQAFRPSIVRELEMLSTFSAAMGLKFDPAAGRNFGAAKEASDLQRQIDLTRLDVQLTQLQRDAELLKNQLAQQTAPNPPPPASADGGADLAATVEPEDANQLLDKIEALRDKLTSRLDSESKPPRPTSAVASPVDLFHDREAYRNTIKSAINATSLDELHDKDGNSLFRVQIEATVLPDAKDYLDTLGILRMEVWPPRLAGADKPLRDLYLEWLLHINQTLNSPPDRRQPLAQQRFAASARLITLGEGGEVYHISLLELPKPGAGADHCKGTHAVERDPARCWYLRIAFPASLTRTVDQAVRSSDQGTSFQDVLDRVTQFPDQIRGLLSGATSDLYKSIESSLFRLDPDCIRFIDPESHTQHLRRDDRPGQAGLTPNQALALAQAIRSWWPHMSNTVGYLIEADYDDPTLEREISLEAQRAMGRMRSVRDAAGALLLGVAKVNPNCSDELLTAPAIEVPAAFREAVTGVDSRVTVYDVAPVEQVQQISTATRAADAIALAASLAGQLPQFGVGASGNFAYTRSAVGKADALERAPLVVGFAEPAFQNGDASVHPAFGWLLGPEVSFDPQAKALVLEHHVTPYELYADVSMPGWWPYFDLKAYTAWAPNWRTAKDGKSVNTTDAHQGVLVRTLRVPMRHNAADMDGLTTLVLKKSLGQGVDRPKIARVEPNEVSACADDIEFYIQGENIWRATLVHLGGHTIDNQRIRVLPDMRGIMVKISMKSVPMPSDQQVKLTVWTHNGRDSYPIAFIDTRKNGTCEKPSSGQHAAP